MVVLPRRRIADRVAVPAIVSERVRVHLLKYSVFLTSRSPGHVPDMSDISDEGLSNCRSGSRCRCHRSRPDPHRVVLAGQVEGVGAGGGGAWGYD